MSYISGTGGLLSNWMGSGVSDSIILMGGRPPPMGFLSDTGVLGPVIACSIPPARHVSCGLSFEENMPHSL